MSRFDRLFVPRRWRRICIGAATLDFMTGTIELAKVDNSGWIQIVGCVMWGYCALREHEKMTK